MSKTYTFKVEITDRDFHWTPSIVEGAFEAAYPNTMRDGCFTVSVTDETPKPFTAKDINGTFHVRGGTRTYLGQVVGDTYVVTDSTLTLVTHSLAGAIDNFNQGIWTSGRP